MKVGMLIRTKMKTGEKRKKKGSSTIPAPNIPESDVCVMLYYLDQGCEGLKIEKNIKKKRLRAYTEGTDKISSSVRCFYR